MKKSDIGKDLFLPAGLLLADAPDFLLEQSLGLQVPPAHLDQLLVVVLLLGVPLVAGTGERGEEQVVQALQLLELVTRRRTQNNDLRVSLWTLLRLLLQSRRHKHLLHPHLLLPALTKLRRPQQLLGHHVVRRALQKGGKHLLSHLQFAGRRLPEGLPGPELGGRGGGEVKHEFGANVAACLPAVGAIALQQLLKFDRLVELAVVAGLAVLSAPHSHQLFVGPQLAEYFEVLLPAAEILPEGEADGLADGCVVGCVKVAFVLGGTAEGVFHGVAVGEVEEVVDGEARGAFPAEPHAEVALVVVEGFNFLPEEVGDVPGDVGTGPVLAAVHEHSLLLGVGVQVDEQKTALLLHYRPLRKVNLRATHLAVEVPHAVQIIARQTAPIAAIYHSIGVQHRHYLENEALPQSPRLLAVGYQEINDAFADEGSRSLARMHAAGNEGHFLLPITLEIGNSDHVHVVATGRLSECLAFEDRIEVGVVGDRQQMAVEHGEGVGRTVGEIGHVCFVLEVIGEGESVVGLLASYLYVVLEIFDVLALPLPGVVVGLAADGDLHAVLEGGVVFEEVDDVEAHLSQEFVVVHSKEEPLRAASSVYILLQQQVVLVLHLGSRHQRQVATLKPALKAQLRPALRLMGRRVQS